MYSKWSVSDDYPDGLWLQYGHESSPDAATFRSGKPVRKVSGPLIFELRSKAAAERLKKFDYLMSDATEVVSERLKGLIEEVAPSDCQFFPADIRVASGRVDGYFVINVQVKCSCVDMKRSKYKPMLKGYPGPPWDFSKIVVVPGCLGSHHVVRPEEELEMIIVDDVFVDACRREKIRGVDFEPLS